MSEVNKPQEKQSPTTAKPLPQTTDSIESGEPRAVDPAEPSHAAETQADERLASDKVKNTKRRKMVLISRTTGGGKPSPSWRGFSQWNNLGSWLLLGIALLLLVSVYGRPDVSTKEIPYSEFKERIRSHEIARVIVGPSSMRGMVSKGALPSATSGGTAPAQRSEGDKAVHTYLTIPVEDPTLIPLLDENKVQYEAENVALKNAFWHWILPMLVVIALWRILFGRLFRMGPGAGLMSFGKNRAKLVADDSKKATFNDVAGVDEAKEELQEIIEFLKTPEKFRAIGGKIPKGILLVGPPGTGKTLLARAVAGEANVPFFSLSGSEFVEMFVGVGAARVRDLFAQAVEKSPCIIFIDELDAIGKVRSAASPLGGHDEREQTLNQLLVEMDGFDTRTGVIIMAATNRPEILDPALLRAGRFDRQVLVDRPDIRGREAILRIHSKNVKMNPDADIKIVAARTPGFVGADLANVVNEAALLAVRKGKHAVELSDFDEAIDRVLAGLQKKTRLINQKEKQIVAFHETGHALVTYFTKDTDPVHKISIIPRGFGALGFTLALPKEDRYLMTQSELLARIDILFGGRVAESIAFQEVSTGAQDDLQKATDIARRMVTEFGMSAHCGPRTYAAERTTFLQSSMGPASVHKEFSEASAEKIDAEIDAILKQAYTRVEVLIKSKRDLLAHIAGILGEREVIDGKDLDGIIHQFELKGPEPAGVLPTLASGAGSAEELVESKSPGEQRVL